MTVAEGIERDALNKEYQPSNPKLQLLPCKVHHTGPAPVSSYLIEQDQTATLRGRGLQGEKITLKDHQFVVLQKQGDCWKAKAKSDELQVWTHDQKPSILNTPIMYLNPWIELSSHLHKTV
jgi:hypothetical protein